MAHTIFEIRIGHRESKKGSGVLAGGPESALENGLTTDILGTPGHSRYRSTVTDPPIGISRASAVDGRGIYS
jgi:hypothetical protein